MKQMLQVSLPGPFSCIATVFRPRNLSWQNNTSFDGLGCERCCVGAYLAGYVGIEALHENADNAAFLVPSVALLGPVEPCLYLTNDAGVPRFLFVAVEGPDSKVKADQLLVPKAK